MAGAKICGVNAVYGIAKPKPLKGLPEGRARVRMRPSAFAEVFVKTASGIRRFIIVDEGDCWVAKYELGSNRTV